MSQTAAIVSIITIVGWLVLMLRGSAVRRLGTGGVLKYAAIWAAIIIALVLAIGYSGIRIRS